MREVRIFEAAPSPALYEHFLQQTKHKLSAYEIFSMPIDGGISATTGKDTCGGPGVQEVPSELTS